MKRFLFSLLTATLLQAAEPITGFWKMLDTAGKAQCVIAIYGYKGLHYGRMVGSYNSDGKMVDTIYHPVEKAPGVEGDRYYSGLDFIWNLEDTGYQFKGKILDPEKGKVWSVEIWREFENLIVRGKLGPFGQSRTCLAATDSDFPKDFKKPDLKTMVPDLPTPK